jgi:hypothetical protein
MSFLNWTSITRIGITIFVVSILFIATRYFWNKFQNNPSPTNLACSENIIAGSPWYLEETNGPDEDWIDFSDQFILKDKDSIRITFNLHGLMAQEGERKNDSTVVLTQHDSWYGISLINSRYQGQNGLDGEQTIDVPISDFVELPNPDKDIIGGAPLDLNEPVTSIRARFWYHDHFFVEITGLSLCTNQK